MRFGPSRAPAAAPERRNDPVVRHQAAKYIYRKCDKKRELDRKYDEKEIPVHVAVCAEMIEHGILEIGQYIENYDSRNEQPSAR